MIPVRPQNALIGLSALGVVLAAPQCSETVLSISGQAKNVVLPATLTAATFNTTLFSSIPSMPRQEVAGTYNISVRYCDPVVKVVSRQKTLQLLVHGATYTKTYWTGLYPQGLESNSWVEYASKQGYPTLAIDRLCNGGSTHANALLECQVPLNAEIINMIIERLKTTPLVGHRTFDTVLPICHSFGSVVCNFLQQIHPTAAETYILSGFTNSIVVAAPAILPAAAFVPDPSAGDTFYLKPTYEPGYEGLFYFGDFDASLSQYNFDTVGTTPTGELATGILGQLPAPAFTGNLLLLNGQNDQAFCCILPTDPLIGGKRGNCGQGPTSRSAVTQSLYPRAKVFDVVQIPDTGHCINLHTTAQTAFRAGHDFLARQGY